MLVGKSGGVGVMNSGPGLGNQLASLHPNSLPQLENTT